MLLALSAAGPDAAAGAVATAGPDTHHVYKQPATPSPAPPPVAVPPTGTDSTADEAYGDPGRALGATSPSCRYALDADSRRACRESGSPAQPHPLSAYGLDVRVGFSLTDPGKTFMSALQSLGAGLWMGLLYLVKAVLLLLEWAFSLDLTKQAMPSVRQTLTRFHEQVFGDPWLLLAITVTGLWGTWHGLVQRRAVETLGGVAATVALIVVALVIITRPAETVGRAAELANQGGLSVLAAGTTGSVAHPRQALASALADVFGETVRNPWCALEFGSVDYCDTRTGDAKAATTAELWLAYPAQSWQRDRLHAAMKPKQSKGFDPIGAAKGILGLTDSRKLPSDVTKLVRQDPERARMQEAGGTFPRLALLGTVTVGLLGAAALYAYLGLRLLLAAAMTLLLLLLAPAMVLAPAFGQRGRATFIEWGQRLIGAIVAKFVFAVFLTVVLAAGGVFTSLQLGWFGTWLMLGAFWWGVFLKRHELIGFLTVGTPAQAVTGSGGQILSQGYYAWMLGRSARQVAGAAVAPARRGASAVTEAGIERRAAQAAARSEIAREHLDAGGERALEAQHAGAREVVDRQEEVRRELHAVDRNLQGYDEAAVTARATRATPPVPSPVQRELIARREQLRSLLSDPTAGEAAQLARHGERNRAMTGRPVSRQDLDVYQARRDRELAATSDPSDPAHLEAAGVDPREYREADAVRRAELHALTAEHIRRERLLREAAAGGPTFDDSAWLDSEDLEQRTAQQRARLKEERRQARAQQGVYRRR